MVLQLLQNTVLFGMYVLVEFLDILMVEVEGVELDHNHNQYHNRNVVTF